jgi:hypothetical protein
LLVASSIRMVRWSVLNHGKMAQFESRIAEYIRTNSVAARISASVDYVGRDGRRS